MPPLGSDRTAHLDICLFFTISHRNKVLNFFFFIPYLRGNVRSSDAKRTHITPWYLSLMKVKDEIKSTSIIKPLNMSLTNYALDFSQKIPEPNCA